MIKVQIFEVRNGMSTDLYIEKYNSIKELKEDIKATNKKLALTEKLNAYIGYTII